MWRKTWQEHPFLSRGQSCRSCGFCNFFRIFVRIKIRDFSSKCDTCCHKWKSSGLAGILACSTWPLVFEFFLRVQHSDHFQTGVLVVYIDFRQRGLSVSTLECLDLLALMITVLGETHPVHQVHPWHLYLTAAQSPCRTICRQWRAMDLCLLRIRSQSTVKTVFIYRIKCWGSKSKLLLFEEILGTGE